MASLHHLPLLVLLCLPTCSGVRARGSFITRNHKLTEESHVYLHEPDNYSPSIDSWRSAPTPHSSVAAFLTHHPVWVDASISFSIGIPVGLLLFFLWRVTIKFCIKPVPDKELRTDPDKEPRINPTLFSPIIRSIEDLSFLYSDTCPSLPVIGRGACGEVYKAQFFTGGVSGQMLTVAIKKIPQPSPMDASHLCKEGSNLLDHRMRQVRSEIVSIGRVCHPYLVRLLAHVPKPECHYLVYEFMTNGSLHDVLKSEARDKMNWPNRLKIAKGVAAGLEYLHMVHCPRIIHRDLKPANILLDDNLNARIADFGLAKMVPEAISGAISSENVAGTLGYIAPEYYQTMSYTDKSDIYSFGVILAVLVTGMFPRDEFFHTADEPSLVTWVRKRVSSDDPSEAVDRTLLRNGFEAEMILVLKIACFCTYDDPKERPNSKEVHCMLSQIKH